MASSLVVSSLLACFALAPSQLPALAVDSTPKDGSLQVRLLFGPDADLDLHVTDPTQETVYFGNSPSLAGGVLKKDLRCDAPAPRVEVVKFVTPMPGRYRVGVDYAKRCRHVRGAVPYKLEVQSGTLDLRQQGEIPAGRFQSIALEFVLEE